MNWPEQCAILACAMNTPLDTIWKFTLGQFVRYSNAIGVTMPFHNPFAGGESQGAPGAPSASGDAITDPRAIFGALREMGAKVVKVGKS